MMKERWDLRKKSQAKSLMTTSISRPVGTKFIMGGRAVSKANCTGLRENFCPTTPFRLLESNLAIQIAIFNG